MTATVQGIEIESLLKWTRPKEVETRNGPRILRTARPDEAFWNLWNSNQGALRSMGLRPTSRPSGTLEMRRSIRRYLSYYRQIDIDLLDVS